MVRSSGSLVLVSIGMFIGISCLFYITRETTEHNIMDSKLLPETEMISYVDLPKLSYSIHSTPRCDFKNPPYLLILVVSAPSNFMCRSSIRQTWGSVPKILGKSIRVVFLLGQIRGEIGLKLHREMEDHNDIVMGNFDDSYRNLTYKHILSYKWFLANCESVSFVMKVDDDVFIDLFMTIHFLTNTFGAHPENLLAGWILRSPRAVRTGKWFVSKIEYPLDFYPDFLNGPIYIITPDVARRIYSVIDSVPFYWIDDVFMTGFVADAAHVIKTDISDRFSTNNNLLSSWLLGNSTQPNTWIAALLWRGHLPQYTYRLWSKTLKNWKKSLL